MGTAEIDFVSRECQHARQKRSHGGAFIVETGGWMDVPHNRKLERATILDISHCFGTIFPFVFCCFNDIK